MRVRAYRNWNLFYFSQPQDHYSKTVTRFPFLHCFGEPSRADGAIVDCKYHVVAIEPRRFRRAARNHVLDV